MGTFYITQDDENPALDATLTDSDGDPVDLSNATVEFSLAEPRGRGNIFTKAVTVVTAADGEVRYSWDAEDTSEPGRYRGEFIVTYSDGTTQRFPNWTYHTVVISRNLEA